MSKGFDDVILAIAVVGLGVVAWSLGYSNGYEAGKWDRPKTVKHEAGTWPYPPPEYFNPDW